MTSGQDEVPELPRRQIVLLTIALEGGLALIAWFFAWVLGIRLWGALDFSVGAVVLGMVLSLPVAAVVIAWTEGRWKGFDRIRRDFDLVIRLFKRCTALDLFVIGMAAGIGEEALFRGVMQPYLGEFMHPLAALACTSVVFGLVHPVSRDYIVFAALMGLYLGILQLWLDNLLVPMVVHGFYDFVALYYGVRFYDGSKIDSAD